MRKKKKNKNKNTIGYPPPLGWAILDKIYKDSINKKQCPLGAILSLRRMQIIPAISMIRDVQDICVGYSSMLSWLTQHYSYPKQCFVGMTIFCRIFVTFNMNGGVFHGIISVPQNIVMDLSDVMTTCTRKPISYEDVGEDFSGLQQITRGVNGRS